MINTHFTFDFPLSYSHFAGWGLLFLAPLSGTRLGASCNALGPLSRAMHSQLALVSVPRLLDTTRPCHWAAPVSSPVGGFPCQLWPAPSRWVLWVESQSLMSPTLFCSVRSHAFDLPCSLPPERHSRECGR